MIKELIQLANLLDKKGLAKEADYLDNLIKSAQVEPPPPTQWSQTKTPDDVIKFFKTDGLQSWLQHAKSEFEELAQDLEGNRERFEGILKYYPGWKQEDFQKVVNQMQDTFDRPITEKEILELLKSHLNSGVDFELSQSTLKGILNDETINLSQLHAHELEIIQNLNPLF